MFFTLELQRIVILVIPSLIIGALVVVWIWREYLSEPDQLDDNNEEAVNIEDNTTGPVAIGELSTSSVHHRRRQRNPFRNIYSNIVHGGDAASSTASTVINSMPHVLQRRHSTVFPLQMAKAATDLFRSRYGAFKRQMSEMYRGELPQPPSEFFEPSAMPEIPDEFKPMFYIHHNVKLLELPANWVLNLNDIEVIEYEADEYIARPGDDDDAMYVVLEGSLSVYISLPEGKECLVKRIEQGHSFFSLLSLVDILMHVSSTLKTISVKTNKRSRVVRYSFRHFQQIYEDEPALWIRPLQIIITRLLHVTLTPLHNHLGLGEELFKRRLDERVFDDRNRNISGHSMKFSAKFRPRQRRLSSSDSESELFSTAIRWFGDALRVNFSDIHNLMSSRLKVVTYEEDQLIIEQGSEANASLILVLTGLLQLSQESDSDAESDDAVWNTFIYPRELVGGLQLLTNEPAFFTVRATCQSKVAVVSKEDYEMMVNEHPTIALQVAHSVMRRLSPFVRAVDFAIDWTLVDSGQAVYRDGDTADSVYVVLSGRLRSVLKKTVIDEFGRDDVLGILEMLQRKPRATTVLAVRFSQLARIPEGLLNFVKMQFPQVGFRLVRLLGQYYNDNRRGSNFLQQMPPANINDPIAHNKNLRTIAIFPASSDVPIVPFTCELYHSLTISVKVLRLSSNKIAETLGDAVLEKQADFRLMKWLNEQEDNFPLVIYECDHRPTNWTRRCLRQADAIIVIANGDASLEQQFIDEYLKVNQDGIRTRKELVLLWKEDIAYPTGTFNWLKGSWFFSHYHIRAPARMFQWQECLAECEARVLDYYERNVFGCKPDFYNDFSRLGRILTGNAVGLVLGGGGARGAAHVGIIKALREHGIPIDVVGGTSIGSMIGGLFAEAPAEDLRARAKTMSSLWRKIWDLTYAHSAMFTGAGFNKTLQDAFGEKLIEDLWLPYFCITTDISTSEMRVHRSGRLWTYSRASMSLAGYLPPLCDPIDGHLLLDGGYVNNLPADVMRSMGAKCVIAVDVGAAPETELYNYGDSLSGFWVLLRKLNPWAEPIRILGMEEIQSRLAFVSCVRQLEMVKKAPYCHYLRPPIDTYRTLDFYKFDEICDIGYAYGLEKLSELVKTNQNVKSVMNPEKLRSLSSRPRARHEDTTRSNNSFTDLAAQISRIPIRHHGGSLRSLNDIGGTSSDSDWCDEEEVRRGGSAEEFDASFAEEEDTDDECGYDPKRRASDAATEVAFDGLEPDADRRASTPRV